jgi:hypothetical protein
LKAACSLEITSQPASQQCVSLTKNQPAIASQISLSEQAVAWEVRMDFVVVCIK